MCRSIIVAVTGRAGLRKLDGFFRHITFGQAALFRDLLHDMAIAITRGKIHHAVNGSGILPQFFLGDAQRLDEFAPVLCPQEPEAADAVADGDLIGGLLLVSRLH